MLKAAIHCNFDDSTRQEAGLRNIRNILAGSDGKPDIVVVCHGPGISLVAKDQSESGKAIAELQQEGVAFLACENTLESMSLSGADLLPGVETVPSGAVEVLRRQQDGYGYFRP